MPENRVSFTALKDVPESTWTNLSKKKVFFGHQSVGFNIVDGLKDVMKENPNIRLNIIETSNPEDFNSPLFAHARAGKNTDPESKINAFADLMKNGIGDKADIAFFKFCYVDIRSKTDVQKVFYDYKSTMSLLKKAYPGTTFVHVTVPLTLTKTSLKTWIKRIIGKKEVWEYDDNIKRNQFNDLLRKEYDGKEPVYDLAKMESTFADGKQSSFTKDGKTYHSLVPDYTHDGGHLNETGRKIAAEQLIILMAGLSSA
jgi:hypothetical protein